MNFAKLSIIQKVPRLFLKISGNLKDIRLSNEFIFQFLKILFILNKIHEKYKKYMIFQINGSWTVFRISGNLKKFHKSLHLINVNYSGKVQIPPRSLKIMLFILKHNFII